MLQLQIDRPVGCHCVQTRNRFSLCTQCRKRSDLQRQVTEESWNAKFLAAMSQGVLGVVEELQRSAY